MKYAHIIDNKLIGWYTDDIHSSITESEIVLNKPIETDLEGNELNQKIEELVNQNKQTLFDNDKTLIDVRFKEVRDNKVILEGTHKTSSIPEGSIEVTDEVWQEALSINANAYEDGKFIAKDLRTAEEIAQQEQARLKAEKEEALRTLTVTTSNGNRFDANLEARTNMNNAITASKYLGRTEENWKLADNTVKLIQLSELEEASALAILAVGNIVTQY